MDVQFRNRSPVAGGLRGDCPGAFAGRRRGGFPGSGSGDRWDRPEQVGAGSRLERQSRRNVPDDGVEQFRCAGRARDAVDIDAGLAATFGGRQPVDDRKPGVEPGSAPDVGAPVDDHGEHRACRPVEGRKRAAPGRVARHAVRRGNGHEPSAGRQRRERRTDMAQVRVVADARDARRGRERRVHHNHRRRQARQEVRDGLGVVSGDGDAGEEPGEEPRPHGRNLVEVQCAVGMAPERALRHRGKHPGACGGFERRIARTNGCRPERGVSQRQGRGELLEANLFLRAFGMRGFERRDGFEHREHPAGAVGIGAGAAAHGAPVAAYEQHDRRFGGFVSVLPHPGTVRIGRAERASQGIAQRRGVESAASLQYRQQDAGRVEQGGGGVKRSGIGGMRKTCRGRTRIGARRRKGVEHGKSPNEAEGKAGGERGGVSPAPNRQTPRRSARPTPGGAMHRRDEIRLPERLGRGISRRVGLRR